MFSIFMRTLCEPHKHKEAMRKLTYIKQKLEEGERKFYKSNGEMYRKIFKLSKDIWNDVKTRHHQKTILNELLFLELHTEESEIFKKYFKLKDTKMVSLYNQYCNSNTVEKESESYSIIEDVVACTNKALDILQWQDWVEVNNRRFV